MSDCKVLALTASPIEAKVPSPLSPGKRRAEMIRMMADIKARGHAFEMDPITGLLIDIGPIAVVAGVISANRARIAGLS